jgi:hypothetical protein
MAPRSWSIPNVRARESVPRCTRHARPCAVRSAGVGSIFDATLSFQLRRGFRVLAVVGGYLKNDPESLGYAAVIEWQNPDAS